MDAPPTPPSQHRRDADGAAAVRARAVAIREQAAELRRTGETLLARATEVQWQGRAAETMVARVRERTERLATLAQIHERAADSLEQHADAVAGRERAGTVGGDASGGGTSGGDASW